MVSAEMIDKLILDDLVVDANERLTNMIFGFACAVFEPKKIIKSGDVTIVFWIDGSKTIVRCQKEDLDDAYTAFCAALGKKVFGSNSALKRTISKSLVAQPKTKYRMKREQEEQEVARLKELNTEVME